MNRETELSVLQGVEHRLMPTAIAALKVVAPSLDALDADPKPVEPGLKQIKPDRMSFGGVDFHDPPADVVMSVGCFTCSFGQLIGFFEFAFSALEEPIQWPEKVEDQAALMSKIMYKASKKKLGL